MSIHIESQLIIALISIAGGVLILIRPKLLNYIVAGYLIFVGVVRLINYLN